MFQRRLCPSVGAIRCSIPHELATVSNASKRFFSQSARQLEDKPDAPSPASRALPVSRTRRTRNDEAASKIASLNASRVTTPSGTAPAGLQAVRDSRTAPGTSRPLIRREVGPSAPVGQLAKAPAKLRISREAMGPASRSPNPRGPNLRGRDGAARREGGKFPINRSSEKGPQKRDKKQFTGANSRNRQQPLSIKDQLSDGMVQHLLRLQRKEWDPVPYVPMYAPGSRAVQELQEDAKKIFQGEVPRVKTPGRLEKVLGIAGMHGA